MSGPTINSGSLFFLAVFCIRNPLKPSRDCIFLIGYIKPWSLAESSNCLILSWFGSVGSTSHCGSGRPEKTNKVIFKFPTTNAKEVCIWHTNIVLQSIQPRKVLTLYTLTSECIFSILFSIKFPEVMIRRICLTIKSFCSRWSFSLSLVTIMCDSGLI